MNRSAKSLAIGTAGMLLGAIALAGCGGGGSAPSGSSSGDASADGGASVSEVTMWTRASTSSQSQALVDAWNAENDMKVNLTVVPNDNYLQKVGVAAGGDQLPCLMSSDVVYMTNFLANGLYQDITDRVDGLSFKDELAQGPMKLASKDGKQYGVPHNVALSALFQNNVLLEQAGIDPAQEITTLEQLGENAAKVAALGPEYTGLYYTGNNGGSITFTHFPSIWASGGQALSEDGMSSLLDSDESIAVFEAYNQMYQSGAVPETVMNESGATRNQVFATGNVGYLLASNSVLETVEETDNLKIEVQGIPGVSGTPSTYIGGDVIGISKSCQNVDEAWSFLEWSLSEEAQVGIFAAMNQLTVRSDLADNEYSQKDPRIVKLNNLVAVGDTPMALNFGPTFNDLNGPALATFREALFGPDPAAALRDGNDAITASLAG